MGEKRNDLTETIVQTLSEMKIAQGEKFNPDKGTGISRLNYGESRKQVLSTFRTRLLGEKPNTPF